MKLMPLMLCAVSLAAAPALANENMDKAEKAKMKVEKHMPMMDTNNDGSVSRAEHDAFAKKKFDDADTNKDGSLSKQEMIDMKSKEMNEMHDMKHNDSEMKDHKKGM